MEDVLDIIFRLSDNYYCFIVCKQWQQILLKSSHKCKKCNKVVKMYDTILWYTDKTNEICHGFYDKTYTLSWHDKYRYYRDYLPEIRQCKALCLDAVNSYGDNLQHIIKQYRSSDLYFNAISKTPSSIQYIDKSELTKCIIMHALRKDGMVLEFIDKEQQTQEIITTALKQNGLALQFVKVPITNIMIYTALKQNGLAIEFIPKEQRLSFIIKALKTNGNAIRTIPPEERTKQLCIRALQSNIEAAKHVPEEHHDIFNKVCGHSYKVYLYHHGYIEMI